MNNAAQTFQAIVNERRSIRAFKPDPVGREVIDAVFAPALRAPSNCNTQPWFVHIVTGDKLEKLRESLRLWPRENQEENQGKNYETVFSCNFCHMFCPEMIEQYSRLFDQAEQETETEPVTLKRIREARLPLVIATKACTRNRQIRRTSVAY